MTIYDFIEAINDTYNIVFKIFDCNREDCVFIPTEDSDGKLEVTAEELLSTEYADLEYGSMDIWMDVERCKIFIEFNVDIDEEDFE